MNEIVRKQIEKAKSGKIIFLADEELSDDFFYEISKLTHLEKLNLFGCKFKDIPDSFSNLINLEALELTENSFQELPLVITKLPKLKHLTVSFGNLTTLPPEFERLKELEYLDISVNPFTFTTSLNVISKFKKLKDLNMSFIPLKDFSVLRNLANLETLSLNGCNLSKLFLEISFLKKLRYLELYKNNFTEFPIQLVNLINLESLDLSENQLSSLPTEINRLQKLETISLRNNNFHKFPTQLLDLPNLKRPLISNNPFSINELKFEYSISVEKRKFTSLNLKGLHFKDISPPYEILYLEDKNNAILLSPELSINDDTFDFLIQVFGNDKTKKTILKKIRDRIETWIINEKIEFENKIKIDEKFKKEKEVNFIRRFFYYPKKDNKKYLEVRIDFDRLIRFGESGENTYFADWRKIPVKDLLDYVGVDDNELTKENIKQEWKGKSFLTEIKINNFKIFNQLEFTLSEHFNIILGRNGLGKTSILQAITLGLLPLANIDKSNNFEEYIRFRADNSEIILNWGDEYRRTYIFKNELNEEEYVNFPQKLILAYGVNLNTNPELDHSEIVDKILNGNALSYSTKSIFSDYATNFHDPLVILEKLILARDESNK